MRLSSRNVKCPLLESRGTIPGDATCRPVDQKLKFLWGIAASKSSTMLRSVFWCAHLLFSWNEVAVYIGISRHLVHRLDNTLTGLGLLVTSC